MRFSERPGRVFQLTNTEANIPTLLNKIRGFAADESRPSRERSIATRLSLLPQTLMTMQNYGIDKTIEAVATNAAVRKGRIPTPEDFMRVLLITAYAAHDMPNVPDMRKVLLDEIDAVTNLEAMSLLDNAARSENGEIELREKVFIVGNGVAGTSAMSSFVSLIGGTTEVNMNDIVSADSRGNRGGQFAKPSHRFSLHTLDKLAGSPLLQPEDLAPTNMNNIDFGNTLKINSFLSGLTLTNFTATRLTIPNDEQQPTIVHGIWKLPNGIEEQVNVTTNVFMFAPGIGKPTMGGLDMQLPGNKEAMATGRVYDAETFAASMVDLTPEKAGQIIRERLAIVGAKESMSAAVRALAKNLSQLSSEALENIYNAGGMAYILDRGAQYASYVFDDIPDDVKRLFLLTDSKVSEMQLMQDGMLQVTSIDGSGIARDYQVNRIAFLTGYDSTAIRDLVTNVYDENGFRRLLPFRRITLPGTNSIAVQLGTRNVFILGPAARIDYSVTNLPGEPILNVRLHGTIRGETAVGAAAAVIASQVLHGEEPVPYVS